MSGAQPCSSSWVWIIANRFSALLSLSLCHFSVRWTQCRRPWSTTPLEYRWSRPSGRSSPVMSARSASTQRYRNIGEKKKKTLNVHCSLLVPSFTFPTWRNTCCLYTNTFHLMHQFLQECVGCWKAFFSCFLSWERVLTQRMWCVCLGFVLAVADPFGI